MAKLLIIDDEEGIRNSLQRIFVKEGYEVSLAGDGIEGWKKFLSELPDVVLLDLKMPGMDGMEVLEKIKETRADSEVIIMTAFGTIDLAVKAVKTGAFDFITKPFDSIERLKVSVANACERKRLKERVDYFEKEAEKEKALEGIIGKSHSMMEIFGKINSVAPTDATVLITGESGTGKELVAKAIHRLSNRSKNPFVAINCSALTETLIESELFGHERGAFTGAVSSKRGLFEIAHGGTVFLDEIGDMPLSLQAKLLRVLQDGEVRRVGGTTSFKVNVRVISATNKDLLKAMKAGAFREDLFYRLSVMKIDLPPLRERKEDIPLLAYYFMKKYAEKNSKEITGINDVAMKMLTLYSWPGNVRELENVIERAVILEKSKEIQPSSLPEELALNLDVESGEVSSTICELPYAKAKKIFLSSFDKKYCETLLNKTGGNVTKAARLAGMDRSNFRKLLSKAGLK